MNWFYINGKEYEVEFNKEELIELKKEIIQNASTVNHKSYISSNGPFYRKRKNDPISIDNYTRTYKYDDEDGIEYFHHDFDEVKYPYIVLLINRLLEDDFTALNEIYRPDLTKEFSPTEDEINSIIDRLQSKTTSIESKIKLTEELKSLYQKTKIDETYGTMIIQYYFKLMNLITLHRAMKKELK